MDKEKKQLEDIKQGLKLIKPYLIKEEYEKLVNKLIDEFINDNCHAYRHELKLLVNQYRGDK